MDSAQWVFYSALFIRGIRLLFLLMEFLRSWFFLTVLHYASIVGDFCVCICIHKISKDFSEELLVGLSASVAMGSLTYMPLVLLSIIVGSCNHHCIAVHINFEIHICQEKKICGANVYCCCCYYCLFYNSRRSPIVPGLLVDTEGCETTEGTSLYVWRMY